MALQSERPPDNTDWKLLRELQQDARLSYRIIDWEQFDADFNLPADPGWIR